MISCVDRKKISIEDFYLLSPSARRFSSAARRGKPKPNLSNLLKSLKIMKDLKRFERFLPRSGITKIIYKYNLKLNVPACANDMLVYGWFIVVVLCLSVLKQIVHLQ